MTLHHILERLITYKTVTGNNAEIKKAFQYVVDELAGLPVFVHHHEYDGIPSLIITTQPNQKNPHVWLAAHMDVVEGPSNMWTPQVKDGRIYGRGAHDMKFAIACYIALFKELGQSLSRYDIGIMLTGDEEVGGFNGTAKLLEEGYRGGVVFLPDGGNTWKIEEAAKGMQWFDITAMGVPAHGSRPWEGVNAIELLVAFLSDLRAVGDSYASTDSSHWHLTYTTTLLTGGVTSNSVATSAQALIDVRFPSIEELTTFKQHLATLCEKHPSVSFQETCYAAPHVISRDDAYLQAFIRHIRTHAGIEPGWTRNHGASDARHFAPYAIPVILMLPTVGGYHTDEEWADIADLDRFYVVLREWVNEIGDTLKPHTAKELVMNSL